MTAVLDHDIKADQPAENVQVHFAATEWGCPEEAFTGTRSFWDETYVVRGVLHDAPGLVTVIGWQAEVGNFSWNSILGGADHRSPAHLVGGADADAHLAVTKDASNAWRVSLGADGNSYVRFVETVRDGDGKQWQAECFVVPRSERLDMPAGVLRLPQRLRREVPACPPRSTCGTGSEGRARSCAPRGSGGGLGVA